jgi:hypothetical protein
MSIRVLGQGAGVHTLSDLKLFHGLQHIPGTIDVDGIGHALIPGPNLVPGRHMIYSVHAFHRSVKGILVGDVPGKDPDAGV